MNLPTLALSTTLLFTPYQYAQADARHDTIKEIQCLGEAIYSESRGESKKGQFAIGYAVINRSKRSSRSICKIKGVTRKIIPTKDKLHFKDIAISVLRSNKHNPIANADSWNTSKKPAHRGKITAIISHHVFYVMNDL